MNHHFLKIYPEHYNNIKDGTKTFEIRKNDRAFQKGDKVTLYYWPRNGDNSKSNHSYAEEYKIPELKFFIGDVYLIDSESVVFSLLKDKP